MARLRGGRDSPLRAREQVFVMVVLNTAILENPDRLQAVDRARRVLPSLPIPLDGIAKLAAQLLNAPMGVITFVGADEEHFAGSFGLPSPLATGGHAPVACSVCKYMVSIDAPVSSPDMLADDDPQLREHPLAREYGVRAFLGVPLRDAGGQPLGSLTVMDTRVREWTDAQVCTLIEVVELIGPVPTAGTVPDPAALDELDTAVLLDAAAEAFIGVDVDARITGWNAAACEMFGYTADEACGRLVDELLKAEYAGDPLRQVIARLLAGADLQPSGPAVLRHRDGATVHADVRMRVLRGAGPTMVCTFITDTTERLLEVAHAENTAEDAIAEQRSFLYAVLDSMREGVTALDADGQAVVFNQALRHLYGLSETISPHEAMTAALTRLRRPDGAALTPDDVVVLRALRGETVRDLASVLCPPGLPDRHLVINGQPVYAPDGRLLGAVSTLHDVTERRRGERFRDGEIAGATLLNEASAISQAAPALLRVVAQTLDWPYANLRLVDDTSGTLHRIAQWHTDGYELHDQLPEHLYPEQVSGPTTVWATGQPMWVPDLTSVSIPHGCAPRQHHTGRGPEPAPHALLCAPVCAGDTVLGVLSCCTDSVEHDEFLLTGFLTRIAGQLGHFLTRIHAEHLSIELDRARSDFTSLIGHDMRTPLTIIAGCTDLLLDDPSPRSDDDRELLDGIARSSTKLRHLIEGLLDLAALQAGDLPLQMCDVDLTSVLAAACDEARPAAEELGLTLNLHVDEHLRVTGDPGRLRQLTGLLLADVIVSHPGGGDVPITLTRDGGAVQITVSGPAAVSRHTDVTPADLGGPGIADDLGAGRAVARAIIERHGGSLTVTGIPNTAATTITARLPLPAGNPTG